MLNRDIPDIFHDNHLKSDVTSEYVGTSDVTIEVDSSLAHDELLYLAVFNAEQWKIVARAPVINHRAKFKSMGNNQIVYLPVLYENHKIQPAAHPFILYPGKSVKIIPNLQSLKKVRLKCYNKFFDFEWHVGLIKPGWKMELFYWNNQWVSCGTTQTSNDQFIPFSNVPEGALLLFKSFEWENTWQRIFIINNGEQKWF